MSNKPYSAAAEQNRKPILEVLKKEFKHVKSVIEIGSGTGQHAVYFAEHLPHLNWQCSDIKEMLAGINLWLDETNLPNTTHAIELNVSGQWPNISFEAAYGANIAHIMHSNEIEAMFNGLGKILKQNAPFCLYGPFNINGEYTSESNRKFDLWLKNRDSNSYIRDKSYLDNLARDSSLEPYVSYQMPSNNMMLCWRKI